jgi:hypothetical protein
MRVADARLRYEIVEYETQTPLSNSIITQSLSRTIAALPLANRKAPLRSHCVV